MGLIDDADGGFTKETAVALAQVGGRFAHRWRHRRGRCGWGRLLVLAQADVELQTIFLNADQLPVGFKERPELGEAIIGFVE